MYPLTTLQAIGERGAEIEDMVVFMGMKNGQIWSRNNELLRELVFVDGLVDMCFATDIGDLFIGKEFSVVYVCMAPVERYLPWYLLEEMLDKDYPAFTRPKMKAADWQIHWTGRRGTKHCMNIPVTFHPRRSSLPKEKTLPEEVKQDDRAATPRFSMQRASLGAVAESLKGKLEEDLTTADRLAVFLHATAKKAREAAASKVWDQDIDPVSLMLGTHNIPDKMDILRVHTKRKSESTPAKDESAEIDMSPQSSSDEEVDDATGVFAEFYRPVEKVEKKYSVKEMMKRLGAEEELKQTTSDNLSIVLTDQRLSFEEQQGEYFESDKIPTDIVKHTKRMKAPVLPNSLFKKKPKLKPSPKPKSDSLTGKAFETQYGDDDESTQGQFFKGAKKKMKAVTQDTIEDSAKDDKPTTPQTEKGDTTEKVLAEKVDTTEKVSVEKEGTTEKESVKKGDTASDVPKRRLSASKASKRRRVDDILRRLAKENWFPKGVPFNLQNMFDALMQLLQPETDSKVLVKAIRGHLRDMIR
nr:hypothetical protein BaRGS_025003 [Batillaria attramentaria]